MLRAYSNFSDARLKAAMDDVKAGASIRQASKAHGLNRQTPNKISGAHGNKPMRPRALSNK